MTTIERIVAKRGNGHFYINNVGEVLFDFTKGDINYTYGFDEMPEASCASSMWGQEAEILGTPALKTEFGYSNSVTITGGDAIIIYSIRDDAIYRTCKARPRVPVKIIVRPNAVQNKLSIKRVSMWIEDQLKIGGYKERAAEKAKQEENKKKKEDEERIKEEKELKEARKILLEIIRLENNNIPKKEYKMYTVHGFTPSINNHSFGEVEIVVYNKEIEKKEIVYDDITGKHPQKKLLLELFRSKFLGGWLDQIKLNVA